MNLYEIRREFDSMTRTTGLTDFAPLRDQWIQQGWEKITEMFVVPSLEKHDYIDAVAGEQHYAFPYDYNGTETAIIYAKRRLDPVPEATLQLRYEYRSGLGPVWFYDWCGTVEEPLLTVTNATLVNQSKTVVIPGVVPSAELYKDHWVRFDPYEDNANPDADVNGFVNPGDFGYQIEADSVSIGATTTSLSLQKAYRGPGGTKFTMLVRPAETQKFVVFGTPTTSEADAFTIIYTSRPQRLYNDTDVPEWPNMGLAIVYMALSIAFEWHQNMDLSKTFWARAVQKVQGLDKRRKLNATLVSDITLGSASARKTGIYGTNIRRYGYDRR